MEDVTLGELARRMDMLHGDVRDLRSVIVERDDLAQVSTAWHAALQAVESKSELQFTQVAARLSSVESWQTWVVRIVLGIVIAAVVGLVVVSGPGHVGN